MFAVGLLLLVSLLLAAVALPAPWSWLIGGSWIAYDTWLVLHHLRRGRRAVARAAGRPPAGAATISVLVAAHNEAGVIRDCLDRLELQAGDEALVLDDGSTDGTAEAVVQAFALRWSDGPVRRASRAGCPVCVLALPRGGKARALNQGLAQARGEVVLTVDADTRLQPGALAAIRGAFADAGVTAACGMLAPVAGGRGPLAAMFDAFQRREYARAFLWRAGWAADGMLVLVSGAFAAYRREALLDIGGFDADSLVEDYEVMYRLHANRPGTRAILVPDARATTDAPASVASFLRQRARWFGGFLATLTRYRRLVGDGRLGALGTWHLRLKTIDMLLPIYGLAALAALVGTWWADGRPHPWVLILLGAKMLTDALLHAWAAAIHRRWLGETPAGWRELPAALAEQVLFQPLRQLGAVCGWVLFARRAARGGAW